MTEPTLEGFRDTPITVVIHTPVAVDDVGAVLQVIAEHWPTAKIDVSHPDGWRIDLPASGGPR